MDARHEETIRPQPGDRGDTFARWLVALALLLPLTLVAVLVVEGRRVERRQREIVRSAMRDYSAVAAWQFARRSSDALHTAVSQSMSHVSDLFDMAGHAGRERLLRDPAVLLARDSNTAKCAIVVKARYAFRVDLPSGNLVVTDSTLPARVRSALVARVRGVAAAGTEPHRVILDTVAGAQRAIALGIVRDSSGHARAVYGIETDSTIFDQVFRRSLDDPGLLPPALVRGALGPDRIRVRLATPAGVTLYTFGATPDADRLAVDTIAIQGTTQRYLASVELEPSLASSLLVGGIPQSPLPALWFLFAIAALLALAALYQLHRGLELARLRTRFVANVSHELRTPLAQISMFAETLMLGRERSAHEGRQFISIIHREARRLSNLVETVLRFAATDARRQGFSRVELQPRQLAADLRETVEMFRPIARGADVDLRVEAADDVVAAADAAALHQVVVNLLDNAVKHGGHGGSVRLVLERVGDEARISVEDDGPGVPEREAQRIFEPFARLEGSERGGGEGAPRKRVPGAGIGLAVVRGIVAAHHGRVWVERAASGGARFVVALPIARRPERNDRSERAERGEGSAVDERVTVGPV